MPTVYMHDAGLFLRHRLRTAVGNAQPGQLRPKHPSANFPCARRDRLKLIPGAVGRNRPRGREGTRLLLEHPGQACAPHNWDPSIYLHFPAF